MPYDQIPVAFVAASLIVLIIPGPGVLYVVARSVGQGFSAALASALGLSCGVLVHVAASTIGLSALLLTSSAAYAFVKYVGACYLIYLGIQTLRTARSLGEAPTVQSMSHWMLFRDGVVVSVFNPKIALFFLAFLPQFVDPDLGSISTQFLILGLVYAGLAFITDSAYGFFAVGVSRYISSAVLKGPWLNYITGFLLVGLGMKAAAAAKPQ